MTGEPRDPHSLGAFMTTGVWSPDGESSREGRAGPQRRTGACLRAWRTTSPRWQSADSALDHVRLGSRTKTALNSSTEMQEMLLCPSGMVPWRKWSVPATQQCRSRARSSGPCSSFSEAISLCFSWILFFWGFFPPQHSSPRYPAYRPCICLLAKLHCLWSSRSFQTPDKPHQSCLHYHFGRKANWVARQG